MKVRKLVLAFEMGVFAKSIGFRFLVLVFLSWFVHSCAGGNPQNVMKGTVFVNGSAAIGRIDRDFICATLDWWPPEKCDYGTCSWGYASLLNLDLNSTILSNAIREFSPLKIRLGGTLQDKVIYDVANPNQRCSSFVWNTSEMFGFTQGCLPMSRWDELNHFFQKVKAKIFFGLNALNARVPMPDGSMGGSWNFSNAAAFINYTVHKRYIIHGWELGNELSGGGVGTRVGAAQYADDILSLKSIIREIYKDFKPKPLVLAPGGFFDLTWYRELINKTLPNSLDVITHHIYNLGPGVDDHLVEKILNPDYLDGELGTFRGLHDLLKSSTTSAQLWVGESGGAYNSGRNLVTNSFIFGFWYLDQLGMASLYNTKTYCRQSLIGGNYGLLNTTTFVPNPDYYSALLWHRLMGRRVLSANFSGSKTLRAYAHCAKNSRGIAVLFINLDGNTTYHIDVMRTAPFVDGHSRNRKLKTKNKYRLPHKHKSREFLREEYHLTAEDGNLQSHTMLLNGKSLNVTSDGEIPNLPPIKINSSNPIIIAPFSILFARISHLRVPACS